jgi:ABC-type transport system involved in multi-copper enzyme maturation permease subunit
MFRVAWRQLRFGAYFTLLLLVVYVIIALITGLRVNHFYDTNVVTCQKYNNCSAADQYLLNLFQPFQKFMILVTLIAPCLIGLFWGAPISAEFEKQTFKVVFTQSITKKKWLISKFISGAVLAVVTSSVLSIIITWWNAKIDFINQNRFVFFDLRDLSPVGYALFGFALGVLIGILFKRQLLAIVATLFIFIVSRLLIFVFIVPHLISPASMNFQITQNSAIGFGSFDSSGPGLVLGPPNIPNAWIYSTKIVNSKGDVIDQTYLEQHCKTLLDSFYKNSPSQSPSFHKRVAIKQELMLGPPGMSQCVTEVSQNYHGQVIYQPANRYWPFEFLNFAMFIFISGVLLAVSIFKVQRI